MKQVTLRRGLAALLTAALSFGAVTQATADTLRIGFQKYGTLTLLKASGSLEKRLAERDIDVRWIDFPAGPQLLEGLNGCGPSGSHAGSPVQWPRPVQSGHRR